jgi:tetrahydromethanopterin:alpha-L-glutamate ligase
MGRIVLFTDDPGWHGACLRHAFAAQGYSCDYVSITACKIIVDPIQVPVQIPGFERTLPDAVFVRGVPGGSLEEVVFYLDILHALKALGIPVYNDGKAIERSVDKGMTSFLLQAYGIPTPPTWVVRDRSEALAIAEKELKKGYRLISKPLFGSQGEGLRLIEKMTDLFWLASSHGIFYLQRFIRSNENGYSDWRVFVINGQVIGTMRRHGVCWLNNVARGARCEAISGHSALNELALKATKALCMDYAGVDIIRDEQGDYMIIEVNSIPAWKGLQSVCEVDVAELLAHDLLSRYINNKTSRIAAKVS